MEELPLPSRTRVVFGENTVDGLGDLVRDLAAGAGRVLLVTDPGLVAIGHVARAEAALRAAGLDVHRHDAVRQNPDTTDVDACRDAITATNPDVLVGFGGGSTIDAAKGANFVFAGGGRMEDYWGKNKAKGTLLPLVAVPTTAGTGTELQSFALIQQASTHQKMACGDPQALPRLAVLDPTLTVTLPRDITACTALDTLGHAIETAVTRARTDTSAPLSGEAFRLVHAHLPEVLADPGDLASRGALLRAAALGGCAIEHSMLGAAHAMANPLTAHRRIPHGHAVALALPHVIRFNAEDPAVATIYAGLARDVDLASASTIDRDAAHSLADRVGSLCDLAGLTRVLTAFDVEEADLDALATEAARQWTAQFNPRDVDAGTFRSLFRAALTPR
ncbi:MAG: alcohol dehydrogenase [Planctomycetes bacterium]|nr:alcohol dehydrogenase [Planctomycetota bacterium]